MRRRQAIEPAERCFRPEAAAELRAAISDAGGVEVFAIGALDDDGMIAEITIHARGHFSATLAPGLRGRPGEVLIHNHPSGVLIPSEADLSTLGRFAAEGMGAAIVDNAVERVRWVVEPLARERTPVPRDRLDELFTETFPALASNWEARPGQIRMAHLVADAIDGGPPLLVEAGTGTGKSLAYLAPAALWALANQGRVVIATRTRNLQAQLLNHDLPLLRKALPELRAAVLVGRSHYLCRTRLKAALADPGDDEEELERLAEWVRATPTGMREDYGAQVPDEVWERVLSDTDRTRRARCPHFETCFYYEARREAARAHLLLVNHALLLADAEIKLRRRTGSSVPEGLLPIYDRLVVDEAHHFEEAARNHFGGRVSAAAVRRALRLALGNPHRRRRGALQVLMDEARHPDHLEVLEKVVASLRSLDEWLDEPFGRLDAIIGASREHLRLDAGVRHQRQPEEHPRPPRDQQDALEVIGELYERLQEGRSSLATYERHLDTRAATWEPADQPLLELRAVVRGLERAIEVLRPFVGARYPWGGGCHWIERRRSRVHVRAVPLDVRMVLRLALWEHLEATVLTSATLAVGRDFRPVTGGLGLAEGPREIVPSPFDYRRQAILGLPTDLPEPRAIDWTEAVAEATLACCRVAGGGVFVLCTSHRLVRTLAGFLERELAGRHAVLAQGVGQARHLLVDRFRALGDAVLVGTDSFWEGVSVQGDALRMVIIPRLPFRVPSDPVTMALHEMLESRGLDAFRHHSLPQAVLRLKQGFGRLIRASTDRGAVVVLDTRILRRSYGRDFLAALPPARRVRGPLRRVLDDLRRFYDGPGGRAP